MNREPRDASEVEIFVREAENYLTEASPKCKRKITLTRWRAEEAARGIEVCPRGRLKSGVGLFFFFEQYSFLGDVVSL
jgi:hypothetical protein